VLRIISGSKKYEITEVGKVHNKELHNMYSSSNKIMMIHRKRMRCRGQVTLMGRRGIIWGMWWESKKRPLRRPKRRWEDNIKMDLRQIGFRGMTGFIWLTIGTSGELLWTR
jgi:hypothetical protein